MGAEVEKRLTVKGVTGSVANISVSDPKARLQGSSGTRTLTGQGCFGSKRGNQHNIRSGGHTVMLDWCIFHHSSFRSLALL